MLWETTKRKMLVITMIVSLCGTAFVPSAFSQQTLEDAERLTKQVDQLYEAGKYAEAIPLAEQVLEIRKRLLGPDHKDVILSINTLADLYNLMGQYEKAEPLFLQALDKANIVLGENNSDYAAILNNLALLYDSIGRYEKAEPLYIQALGIMKKLQRENHTDYSASLNNLARLYRKTGQYNKAEPLFLQAVDLTRKLSGENHPNYAIILNGLALLYTEMGRYKKAEPMYIQALEIREKALGKNHPGYATSLSNLASLYYSMGRYEKAEAMYIQTSEIIKGALGEAHPDYATSLNNLALLYDSTGRYEKAEPLYIQAVDITKKALGENHTNYAMRLNNLALLYKKMGRYEKAEPLYIQALNITRKALGENHPSYAMRLNNLAALYYSTGIYEKAEPLYIQASDITKKALGENHPDYAASLTSLAGLYGATNQPDRAIAAFTQAMQIEQANIRQVFNFSSEPAMRAYLATVHLSLDGLISVLANQQATNLDAARIALEWVLRRKAIILDSLIEFREGERLLKEDDKFAAMRARYQYLGQQLSNLPLRRPKTMTHAEYGQQMTKFRQEREGLQGEMNRALTAKQQDQSARNADVASLKHKLVPGTALVEFAQVSIYDFKTTRQKSRWRPAHYFAFVLRAGNTAPQMIDLGEAKTIDEAISATRRNITEFSEDWQKDKSGLLNELEREKQYKKSARHLYDLVFAPLRKHLSASKTIYIAPDHNLSLLPFEALVDSNNKYLIENYSFDYVTSGRDLLRAQTAVSQGTAIFAYPDYDMKPDARVKKVKSLLAQSNTADTAATTKATDTSQQESVYSGDVSRQVRGGQTRGEKWEQQKATLKEAEDIEQQMKTTAYSPIEKYIGENAIEETFKRIKSPRLLHVTTHGFFPNERENGIAGQPAGDERAGNIAVIGQERLQRASIENPLLSCGLVLAGANTIRENDSQSGLDDGWVTAEEIALMNLQGTELVVLSACGSGLGKVSLGEGVYGLRRAFQNAGARTIVSTLFSVPDGESRELMKRFYEGLKAGRGKLESLREAQLKVIEARRSKEGAAHPFFWASFVLAGDPN